MELHLSIKLTAAGAELFYTAPYIALHAISTEELEVVSD